MHITAFFLGDQILLSRFREAYTGVLLQESPSEAFYRVDQEGYLYVFDYGAVVFANVPDSERSRHLALLQPFCVNPLPEKLRDDFEVHLRPGEPMEFQFETLVVPTVDENVVRIVLLNLAQTVTLDYYAERARTILRDIQRFAHEMETRGDIRITRRNMLRFIGRTLNSKNRIIENLFIFESPDLTWDDEYLDRIHRGLARTFELQSRFREIEYTFKVIEDNLSVFRELFLHRESTHLEIIIIVLICIEVVDLFISKIL
jgi:uncharacterized Rmd1/YagE family protein